MKYLSVVVGFVGLGGAVANGRYTRPWELVLRADPLGGYCTLISLGLTQINKDLAYQEVVKEVTTIPVPFAGASRTVVRFLSHDVDTLVPQAQLQCSNDISASLSCPISFHSSRSPNQIPLLRDGASRAAYALDLDLPPLEVIPLITSGPAQNRVDLAFFADGYIAAERQKFIDDATRLARDMSTNQTFFTVRPLLNFWAVFTPSKESGIGIGGRAKDTPFGLYRDGTELRGLYANNSDVAPAACVSLDDKCNYAIFLANDPLYGGLGGEYITTTASLANGALVLRHEIGHSIIENVTWAHWLTHKEDPHVERSVMSMQAYPWTLLNTEKPCSFTFLSSGTYARHLVKFSLSGIPHANNLVVCLDGVDLGWTPRADIDIDRWHYDLLFDYTLTEGEHVIEFSLRNRDIQGQAQLCSVEVLEYGSLEEFNATTGYYSLFPTFDLDNRTSYRPTNVDCVLRSVTKPHFCSVCLEGLWLSLLRRVDLIEDLGVTCSSSSSRVIAVDLVKLAQFREQPIETPESYVIEWTRNGHVLKEFANLTSVELNGTAEGTYRVDITYATDEVRLDPRGYLHASRTFDVTPYSC